MKMLCVADLHAEEICADYLNGLLEKEKPDVVLIAGDLTDHGPLSFAADLLNGLAAKKTKVYAVHGNMDASQVKQLLEDKGASIHGKTVVFKGCRIGGIGGSNKTPFNTVTEYSEEEIAATLEKLGTVDILVSHFPPQNTNADKIPSGSHVGSPALRQWIEAKKPKLVFCAHIHENSGVEQIGETKLVKIAPLTRKGYATVEWPSLKTEIREG
ncbi:YfcE family phosphodiesterase [Candidatus Micrarchaeota archaeon CG_4_10_14_0_2_um_filter_55_9]|nr:MAG: YfcE family phosphodiesterase [Candidatus Micrarchaeota archaeon CG_4_10_14_0_2_um_filter_55_9]